jgi:hypothetical protein
VNKDQEIQALRAVIRRFQHIKIQMHDEEEGPYHDALWEVSNRLVPYQPMAGCYDVGNLAEIAIDAEIASQFITGGLEPCDCVPEPSAVDRKSEPEYQAQLRWARDAVSNVIIPAADDSQSDRGAE